METAALLCLLSPFGGLLTCAVLHILVSRAAPGLSRPRALAVSGLAGLVLVLAVTLAFGGRSTVWTPGPDRAGATVGWMLTYLCLAYCYIFGFYNPSESARRIRLLVELRAVGGRGLTLDEILTAYNARIIVEARLQRLLSSRQIVERGGRYFAKPSAMLFITKAVGLLRILLGK